MSKILFAGLLLLQFVVYGQAVDRDGIPEQLSQPRLVNDFAGILSNNNLQALEDKLDTYNDSTSIQICIVTVKSIGDYSIEDYAVRLGRKWGIGQQKKNNGILIIIAKEERKIDIEIGYGLESYITDYDSKHIINDLIVPAFKQSNYYKGLDDAVNRIIGQLQGTYTDDNYENATNKDPIPTWVIVLIIITVVFFILVSAGGGRGGGISRSGGNSWTWSSGGGSSWSNSSSGGFGGFGGGSFGGGGSSGSW